jgi:site-specific DNA recombinase
LISLASKAPDLFERSNNAEKRLLIGFVFSNLTLEGPTLRYSLRKPFDLLVDLANNRMLESGEIEPGWLALLCGARGHRRS